MFEGHILDKSKGAPPLYFQLRQILKQEIEEGRWEQGDIIPGEKDLISRFEISRTTVRQAIADLTNLGYLKGERGIGTVVTFSKINENLEAVVSFSEEMKRHGVLMSSSLCTIHKERASKYIAHQLGVAQQEEIYCLIRVRCANGAPLVYSRTFLPNKLNLPLDAELYSHSLYDFLRDYSGEIITSANDVLEATLPTEEIMEHLGMSEAVAVFKRTRKAFNQHGEQLEFSLSYYHGERYKYNVDL